MDSRFDCRDLLQRSVIHYGTAKAAAVTCAPRAGQSLRRYARRAQSAAINGFESDRLVELINAGLASVMTERVIADDRAMEVTRVRITEAGRRALAGRAK